MLVILSVDKLVPTMRRSSHHRGLSAFLLLVICFSITAPSSHARAKTQQLSSKDRATLFEQVWRLIGEKYYDANFNGVNWSAVRDKYRPLVAGASGDAEFYSILKEMTGELHDAHTRFRSPAERKRAHKLQATTPGISLGEVDQQPVIVSVEAGSEAAHAGVKPGMIVISVDGVPFAERLAKARAEVGMSSSSRATALLSFYAVLAGEPDTTVRLGLQREDGSLSQVELQRHIVPVSLPIVSRRLPSGYLYVKFDLFDESVAKRFTEELERAKDAAGVVIDLRGNPGGEFDPVLRIANNFFSDRVSFGRVIARSGKAPSLIMRILGVPYELQAGTRGKPAYAGPVTILVNEASGSAAEIFAAGMQENHRATIVGRQTCGCVLATVAHSVRNGSEVDISEFGIVTGQGLRLEGSGVSPDVTVPLTLHDLREHYDATLREGVAVLNSSARTAAIPAEK